MVVKKRMVSCIMIFTLLLTLIPQINTVYATETSYETKEILLFDDFEGNSFSNIIWRAEKGTVDCRDRDSRELYHEGVSEVVYLSQSIDYGNYTVEVTVDTVKNAGYPGILGRVQDKDNFYMFRLNGPSKKVEFIKREGNKDSVLKEQAYELKNDTKYVLTMEFDGDRISCFVNGEEVFTIDDSTYSTGGIGIRNNWGKIYIDHIFVTADSSKTRSISGGANSDGSIGLDWDSEEDDIEYNILRANKVGNQFDSIKTTGSNYYNDNNMLLLGNEYYYKVFIKTKAESLLVGPVAVKAKGDENWKPISEEEISENDSWVY